MGHGHAYGWDRGCGHWGFSFMGGHGGHGCGHGHHRRPLWPFFQMFMGRGPRAGRGEVRTLILDAIADKPRHGYEIIQTIEERTGGYRPSPGTVYPTLQLLEETDLATASEVEGRKVYAITDAGRVELEKRRDELEDAHDRLGHDTDWFDPEEFEALWRRIRRVGRGFVRAGRRGRVDGATLRAIEAVIDHAAERIQEILDQGPPPEDEEER